MRLCVALLLSVGLVAAPAQTKKKSAGGNPANLLMQLQNSVRTAMYNTELKEKDKKKVEKALDRLQKQIDARSQGKRLDPGEIRKAVDDIASVTKQFREEDQRAIVAAINEIRDRKLDAEKERQPKNQRLDPYPRNPRNNPNIYGPPLPRRR